MNNIGKGALGEKLAEDFLVKNKYMILNKNCILGNCEIDIVAKLPKRQQFIELKRRLKNKEITLNEYKNLRKQIDDLIVFVEVKYSSSKKFGEPYERVNKFKQNQIIKASQMYVLKYKIKCPVRFDVVSIVDDKVEYIVNAFEC